MKITLRLIISLLFVAGLVATGFGLLEMQAEKERLVRDLDVRAAVCAEAVRNLLETSAGEISSDEITRAINRLGSGRKFIGAAVCDTAGQIWVASSELFSRRFSLPLAAGGTIKRGMDWKSFEWLEGERTHFYVVPLYSGDRVAGALAILQDASHMDARSNEIWKHNFFRFLTLSALMVIVAVIVVRWSITGPIAQFTAWLRRLRAGRTTNLTQVPRGHVLKPLTEEISLLAKSLSEARAAAKRESSSLSPSDPLWTAERLKEHIRTELNGKALLVVSNREPYMHVRQNGNVACIMPAGGLVSALDPILRACGGMWIAHGGGVADREVTDEIGKLQVPPDHPLYTLRRIWLTKEEEAGYYYGFSNEGLWPLCHITHTRPTFRLEDWLFYQKVNEKFARAVLEEIKGEEHPLVLIQDYHFALLPLLIKSAYPSARVGIFWHIPWPNPETFSICPWKEEILLGLLGADLIGFQTQFHCNNFLDTADRLLESKINWDQFSVERRGQLTRIRPFPISVVFPGVDEAGVSGPTSKENRREQCLKEVGVQANYLAVGVDRIDYTKGIIERCRALERFFEKYPDFIGKFTFVEFGAPSRTRIKRYHNLLAEVEEIIDNTNWRFQTGMWKPIIFLKGHHGHEKISRFYRAADLCMVTSLHDGMNLVAKEFIASRDDEGGVLILSQFTGASRELQDAIIVNPYDIEEMAEAIHFALTMKPTEVSRRMRQLREVVRERNVYRWASNLITTLARIRLPRPSEEVMK